MLGLRADDCELRAPLEGWVRRLGFRTQFTTDAREAVAWLSQEDFAASIVDSWLGRDEGQEVWRSIRPAFARRTVLLARDQHRGLWFEALRSGLATVLPLPPHEAMVRAAVAAATHAWRARDGRFATDVTSPRRTHPRSSPGRARDAWDTN
jgi:DNA-binding NtrC family response regulator